MEQHLKEIAKELKLIRIELQRDNDFYMPEEHQEPREVRKPDIADQLNQMFGKDTNG